MAGLGATVTLAGVTDGTSQTALWSEIVRGKNGTATPGPNQVYMVPIPAPASNRFVPLARYRGACQDASVLPGFDHKGQVWGTDFAAQGGGYSHIMTPNQRACLFPGQAQPLEYSATCVGPSSFHRGGVNVGLLDGSVRFVKDGVDPRTWWALATMAGGEVVEAGGL